jgi:ankyrin repeat protein
MKFINTLTVIALLAMALYSGTLRAETAGVDVSNNLFEAIEKVDMVSLNVLLAEGAEVDSVDENGNTPLMLASRIGNPRMVKIILAHDPEVNIKNRSGFTALMIASEQGQVHIVEKLIQKGADISLKNDQGLTAVEIALRVGQPQTASLIRQLQDDPVTR